jgi:cell division initiation protein
MSAGEFKSGFRGYDRKEVDARIRADAEQLSSLRAELTMLRSEMDGLKRDENSIKQTMLLAQKAKEEALEDAKNEGAQIVQEARRKAEEIAKENKAQIEALRWDLEKLLLDKQKFIETFRKLLEDHLSEIAQTNRGLSLVEGTAAIPEITLETKADGEAASS